MDKKVLLVADDVDMSRSVIKRFFRDEYEVLEAADGEETLKIVEDYPVDALILDIIMPKINGIEVLQKLRENKDGESIAILVASSTTEKTERMALQYGADDVVPKPYDPIIIRKRLENIIAKKELVEQQKIMEDKSEDLNLLLLHKNKVEYLKKIEKMKNLIKVVKENVENSALTLEYMKILEGKVEEFQELLKEGEIHV